MIQVTAPTNTIKARVQLSGSKSISNRILLLNAVFKLNLKINNLSQSEDTQLLQQALQQIRERNNTTINIGHAGTDMRFLTAFLSITKGEWFLTGSDRMKHRPIGELVTALKKLGADITYLEKENYPPLKINGKTLKGGEIEIDGSISSQFISALLLISPSFENGLVLNLKGSIVSLPYIKMTVELLKHFGMDITLSDKLIRCGGSKFLIPASATKNFDVESDWSSASYWYSICALSPNSEIEISTLTKKSLQADSVLAQVFEKLGVTTVYKQNSIVIYNQKTNLSAFEYDCTNCPDIAQTLAVTCFGLGIAATLKGLQTLKIKETDRILALKSELEKFDAHTEITANSIAIKKRESQKEQIKSQQFDTAIHRTSHVTDTYSDHRMAMSFSPLALVFNSIKINNPEVVGKSYPSFWEDLKSVGFSVNLLP